MKKFVQVSSDEVWKCCECEIEYPLKDKNFISSEEINEVDYDFGDEILTVLVCNDCMYTLDIEKLKEIR